MAIFWMHSHTFLLALHNLTWFDFQLLMGMIN